MDDRSLWERIQQGDEEAFKHLFYTYYRLLVTIAMRYVNNLDQARDLVQDVLLNMWEKRDTIKVNKTLKSYLSTATRNTCLNHLKSDKKWSELGEHLDIYERSAGPVEQMATNELQEQINGAIDTLPTACKTIFLLRRIEGLSLKEIAAQLQISPKTVENQITKARRVLAAHLQDYLRLTLWLLIGDSCWDFVLIMIY